MEAVKQLTDCSAAPFMYTAISDMKTRTELSRGQQAGDVTPCFRSYVSGVRLLNHSSISLFGVRSVFLTNRKECGIQEWSVV